MDFCYLNLILEHPSFYPMSAISSSNRNGETHHHPQCKCHCQCQCYLQLQLVRDDSSSATASNLPGAGRTMGKLFSLLGAALERRIYWSADKLGFGPLALRRKLSQRKYSSLVWELEQMPRKQQKNFITKLMKYARSVRSSFHKPHGLSDFT